MSLYKLVQELWSEAILLQNGASIILKEGSFALLQKDKRNCKVGQFGNVAKSGNRYYNEWYLLQKRQLYCKMGRYYKLGPELLENGVGNVLLSGIITLQSGATINRKAIHLCDTRTICLLIGSMWFDSAVHSVHPPSFLLGGVGWVSDQIFKKGGAWQDLNFLDFFGGLQFLHKK